MSCAWIILTIPHPGLPRTPFLVPERLGTAALEGSWGPSSGGIDAAWPWGWPSPVFLMKEIWEGKSHCLMRLGSMISALIFLGWDFTPWAFGVLGVAFPGGDPWRADWLRGIKFWADLLEVWCRLCWRLSGSLSSIALEGVRVGKGMGWTRPNPVKTIHGAYRFQAHSWANCRDIFWAAVSPSRVWPVKLRWFSSLYI